MGGIKSRDGGVPFIVGLERERIPRGRETTNGYNENTHNCV
jgi:hypothetical protein